MYKKSYRRTFSISPWAIAILLFVALIAIGYVMYGRMSSENILTSENQLENPTTSGGTVKVLATLDNSPTTAGATANSTEKTVSSTRQLTLPPQWTEVSSETLSNFCNTQRSVEKKTYSSGDIRLTTYRSGSPNECDAQAVGDTRLKLTRDSTGTNYKVDTSTIVQCTKEQTPACPKGDGKVTVYAHLDFEGDYPTSDYAFVIEETAKEADFATQVRRLAELIGSLKLANNP